MATIKSYTDIEQSKKLAEILPLESADMCWQKIYDENHMMSDYRVELIPYRLYGGIGVPCWSLAALLNLLPNEISTGERYCDKYQIDIRKYDGGDNTTLYQIAYGNNRGLSGSWHDMINTGEKESAIDACYEMILKLNELNLL